MAALQLFYWLLAGALLSFGLLGLLSIGFPFLLVGCIMVIYGVIRFRFGGFWTFLVGFGVLPLLILAIQIEGEECHYEPSRKTLCSDYPNICIRTTCL